MRLTRLYLRNFRVYEEPVELEMPPGLVGIYGRNGSGKSTLLESIIWTMWGKARTSKDQIRTSGVNADGVTEVEFEHEGHLYLVRRTISGIGHTVRAQAHADGSQVAEGVRDVARYVHSVLGMDDVAFRASVFAEQNQLAAFSSQGPAERRKLVMQLLGITPLEGARDQARKDARAAAEQLSRVRTLLPDRARLDEELEEARRVREAAGAELEVALQAEAVSQRALDEATAEMDAAEELGRTYEALVKEGRALRAQRDEAAARQASLDSELGGLAQAAARLAELEPLAEQVEEASRRLERLRAAEEASAAVRALAGLTPPPDLEPAVAELEEARSAAEEARAAVAAAEGSIKVAAAQARAARAALAQTAQLTGGADCPLCGQELGGAFESVLGHRRKELAVSEAEVARLEGERVAVASVAAEALTRLQAASARHEELRRAWSAHDKERERHCLLSEAREAAVRALGREPEPGEGRELASLVASAQKARAEADRIRGRLERRSAAEAECLAQADRVALLGSELENLREKVRTLEFRPEELTARRDLVAERRREAQEAQAERARAQAERAAAGATVAAQEKRREEAEEQYRSLDELQEEARHLGRLSDLLNVFRNTVVASVGPRLSVQAADLFAELTDREYDRLEVDPDTYEIQIHDHGVAYGMDRFSGSETDLANLALRVAISEHVRFQSGGAVGLLVLDEVFGPLDEDRKERMLLALERLRSRFRQVLVVTHAGEIKEQLPAAIEVVKLPGRRATARVVNG
jgi:exonuclease SbcC